MESKMYPKEFNPKYKVGESVIFTQPYFEGTEPQTINVVIVDTRFFGRDKEAHYMFSYENNKGVVFVWYPESMFSYREVK